jgi:hypothetical protein
MRSSRRLARRIRNSRGRRRFGGDFDGVGWAVDRTGGRVHSAPELVDRVEGEVRGDFHRQQARREASAAIGRKVGAKQ